MTEVFIEQIERETAYATMTRWIARMHDACNRLEEEGKHHTAMLLHKERENLIKVRDSLPFENRLHPAVFYNWKELDKESRINEEVL